MDVKQAVARAKTYVEDLFEEEKPANIALEEVEFDNNSKDWLITIGFNRALGNSMHTIPVVAGLYAPRRSCKVVRISDETGDVRSVKNHDTTP